MSNIFQNGKSEFDKIYVFQYADPDNGFFAHVTTALNYVRISLKDNALPIINFDKSVSTYFYDSSYGENIWAYFFEPVLDISFQKLRIHLRKSKIDRNKIRTFKTKKEIEEILNPNDPDYIKHFWVGQNPDNTYEWMKQKRSLGRKFVSNYLKPKKHITSIVSNFYEKFFHGFDLIGVHIRGTDFGYADPISPKRYFNAIKEIIPKYPKNKVKIFLATDQAQFVEAFKNEFGNILITYGAFRSTNELAPFHMKAISPYKKGEDVLVDALLLSKCNFLFKCASAVGEYALWFNPNLEFVDFALESRWDANHVAPAALKLNVNNYPSFVLNTLLLYKKLKRNFLDFIIYIGRKTLPTKLRDWLWIKIGRYMYFFK